MAGEIDWSIDDGGFDANTQRELDAYLQDGGTIGYGDDVGYSDTGEEVQDWQNVSTTGDTTSGNMFAGADLAKLFEKSPVLSGLLKTLGAAGIGSLADKLMGVTGGPGGYKGGIPELVASRQMNQIPATMMDASGKTISRRPGSGGVTYFSPMQYAKAGAAPVTPPAETVTAPVEVAAAGGLMGYAGGGIANLGGYSDGGRLLKGPGDGVSDSIPAQIGNNQPARLADGEFVVPARIVSELGNGSTEAGAKQLYKMMDRIQAKRRKTKNMATDTKSYKALPA